MEKKIAYGPAMLALTPEERKFVHGLYEHNNNFARAVAEAGYEGRPADLDKWGREMGLQANIQEAIREMQPLYLARAIPLALNTTIDIMTDPSNKASERLAASKEANAMAGLGGKQEITVKHEYTVNSPEFLTAAKAYALKKGIDPRKLLGSRADIEDAEVIVPEFDPEETF